VKEAGLENRIFHEKLKKQNLVKNMVLSLSIIMLGG